MSLVIDKLIMEHVMGYEEMQSIFFADLDRKKTYYCVVGSPESEEINVVEFAYGEWRQYDLNPSEYIRDAWIVVEKLQENWNINVGTANPYSKENKKARIVDKYYCEIYGEKTILVYEKSVPLAICLAALKTVGIEVELQ